MKHPGNTSLNPWLRMSWWKLESWFKSKKGKVKKRVVRPILTPERKQARVEWSKGMIERIKNHNNQPFYVAFLDEKWVYVRSGCKRAKYLPPGPGENDESAALPLVTAASRRFATKVSSRQNELDN